MPAPSVAVPKSPLATGPGYWFHGDLGSALPANTVVGGIFTDTWDTVSGWHLGTVTRDGSTFAYNIETETIFAAEYFDGLTVVTTSRAVQFRLEPMIPTATWLKRFLNGGTLSTSGSGTTLLSTYTPPSPGSEVRCMLGWESQDNTERLVIEQAFQTGSIEVSRRKAGGDTNASFPLEFTGEVPASGFVFRHFFAGTGRG